MRYMRPIFFVAQRIPSIIKMMIIIMTIAITTKAQTGRGSLPPLWCLVTGALAVVGAFVVASVGGFVGGFVGAGGAVDAALVVGAFVGGFVGAFVDGAAVD